ncbi:protoheme IX farnesyltransferase [Pneumocystis jirovecii RU7]|uniref:Protoheme IX farnesyltransferase, mitochondrial n=1 Tax=Pneumocystis jirovecii (strain RU7) TaxID=1408657 RepID=A0A0W4ZQ40_PNEJ7|nr:protoheme IX farnesyltransferase [Pneumocystis jirovecii RU7]KTW30480.1 protoheme IX farnesyltransferase [Pneumocystis jirovecii RU7]
MSFSTLSAENLSKNIKKSYFQHRKIQSYVPVPARPSISTFIELTKPRLTFLVVLSAMSSYALAPFPSASMSTLIFLTFGTTLCSSSANAFNMLIESAFDAQMSRTRSRPLVRGIISLPTVFSFVCVTGFLGIFFLAWGVNGTTALLGITNIFLYAGVYTPLKRISIINTWVGAIVGALPPLMGWSASSNGDLFSHLGGWVLAGILYAWQFPHFNSLSWNIRQEYARAGYHMTCIINPSLNARVSLRYSLLCFLLCWALPVTGLVDSFYFFDSSVINMFMTVYAWKFYRHQNEKNARELFFASLIHLPCIFLLALIHKIVMIWPKKENKIQCKNSIP